MNPGVNLTNPGVNPGANAGETDTLDDIIRQSVNRLVSSQNVSGCWEDCFDTGAMADAQTAICLSLLGVDDKEWTGAILSRILTTQRKDGSWGIYPGDAGDLSTSIECYYALALYNGWKGQSAKQQLAEAFILKHGGLKQCRNLTKVILAIGGEIPWSWLPNPKLYLMLFSSHSPIAIWDIVTFTRLHIAPMLILSSMKYQAGSLVKYQADLSGMHESEAVQRPVLSHLIRRGRVWNLWRGRGRELADSARDIASGLPSARRALSPTADVRLERCLQWMLQCREDDGTAACYHSSTFLVIFVLRALGWPESHAEIQSMLREMRRTFYVDDKTGYCHQQTCDAHVWNTALAVKALIQSDEEIPANVIRKAVSYLASKQHRAVGEWALQSSRQPGGWAFSSNNTMHPDTDDTVACLEVLSGYLPQYERQWRRGVDWLLGMQNRDGGWSAFDRDSNKRWLERIPANDMRRAMCDPSTPDITGRVVEFLLQNRVLLLDDHRTLCAIRWLRRQQEADGSWFGRWGTTYLYGTWCAVKALRAAEVSSQDSVMQKAKSWLLGVQRMDGSFGESCQSDLQGRYVPSDEGLPTQTSWGLDALLHLYEIEEDSSDRQRVWSACKRAATWLQETSDAGGWTEVMPTGSAFPGALHIRYHIYPKVWPLVALSHFRRADSLSLKGGEQDA